MKWSLKVKTLALVTTLVVLVAAILTVAHTNRQRDLLFRDLERLTEVLTQNLAFNSEYGVLVGNREGLQDLVEGVMRERTVAGVLILDRGGVSLASGARGKDGEFIGRAVGPHPEIGEQPARRYVQGSGAKLYLVQHPVLVRRQHWGAEEALFPVPGEGPRDVIGAAVVGVSTASLVTSLRQVQYTTVQLTGLIVLAAWCLSYLLVNLLIKPLQQLKAATHEVAAGNLDIRLDSSQRDEVGDLTRSFNQMVHEMRQSRNRIEEYTRQLETTMKELSSLNQEMEDLLRVASHDLRAPLINIQGFTKRLEPIMAETVRTLEQAAASNEDAALRGQIASLRTQVQTRFAESLRFISKGVEKMDALLTSLLAVSRVARKADPIQPNDLNAVLEDVLAVFDHQLTDRSIEVIRHPLPERVACRRNEINQVFSNLVSNAINYMGAADRRYIEIGGTERAEEVECYIRDTGIGIAEEDQERIFNMFTRLQSVDVPGEGVGLAYVRKILRSHGGRLWVQSKKGQGSTFFFTLPRQRSLGMPVSPAHASQPENAVRG